MTSNANFGSSSLRTLWHAQLVGSRKGLRVRGIVDGGSGPNQKVQPEGRTEGSTRRQHRPPGASPCLRTPSAAFLPKRWTSGAAPKPGLQPIRVADEPTCPPLRVTSTESDRSMARGARRGTTCPNCTRKQSGAFFGGKDLQTHF